MTLELKSPSYTARDIEKWAENNELNNDIARRLKTKYFNGRSNFNKTSLYEIVITNNGGVILKKAHPERSKSRAS